MILVQFRRPCTIRVYLFSVPEDEDAALLMETDNRSWSRCFGIVFWNLLPASLHAPTDPPSWCW